jgi:hypothetical protein
MTKKHFEFIASTIESMPTFSATLRAQKLSCANTFADAFAKEFPKFDRDKFLQACGVYYFQ